MLVTDAAYDASDGNLLGSAMPGQGTPLAPSVTCELCSLRGGCLPRNLRDTELAAFAVMAKLKRNVRRSAQLFRAGDTLTSVYVVRSGTFKNGNRLA